MDFNKLKLKISSSTKIYQIIWHDIRAICLNKTHICRWLNQDKWKAKAKTKCIKIENAGEMCDIRLKKYMLGDRQKYWFFNYLTFYIYKVNSEKIN